MPSLRRWLRETITYKIARRIIVAVIGGTVLLVGIAMVVLPGPAVIVIPIGLGILGAEFAWARIWLRKLRTTANGIVNGWRNNRRPPPDPGGAPPPAPPAPPPPGPVP